MNLSLILAKGGILDPIAKPLAAVLAFFYSLVPNYGIAIVLLTIAMMIVLTPLTIKQTRSMLVMQKLQPEMKKLQEQHKNDRQALNEAVMALYKEHNASPLGGCLPMLLPFPLFIALLRVLEGLSHTVHQGAQIVAVPKYLTAQTRMAKDIVKAHGQLDAFGMNLAKSARNAGGGFAHSLPYFVLLLIMVGTQFYQQYQLTSRNPAAKSQPGQAAMMKFIPIFFGLISLNFPAGVVLYWTVSNIIRIGQQWALYRYDPKVKALVAQDVKEIEAKTLEIDAKKAKPAQGKASRPSLRNLLANAGEAAADRRNRGGKNGAKPGGRPAGAKPATSGRGGRVPSKPTTDKTPGTSKGKPPGASGAGAGAGPGAGAGGGKRPLPPKGNPQKGAPPRGGPLKPAPAKGSGGKPGGSSSDVTKAIRPKSAGPKPLPAKPVAAGGTPKSAPGGPTAKPPALGGGTAKPPAASEVGTAKPPSRSQPAGATKPAVGNGAAKPPATLVPGNGAAKATGNGSGANPEGADKSPPEAAASAGNGSPAKGRTGGGSARNMSSRRRRRGR